jgi:hypothetical protein
VVVKGDKRGVGSNLFILSNVKDVVIEVKDLVFLQHILTLVGVDKIVPHLDHVIIKIDVSIDECVQARL